MKTFLITGGNLVNKGAQAMLLITVDEIRIRYPDAEIYYTTHESENKIENIYRMKYAYKYSMINALGKTCGMLHGKEYLFSKLEQTAKCILKHNYKNIFNQKKYERIVKNIDVMIDISGYNLTSQWPLRISRNYLNTIKYAHANNVKIYLMPQSFGPFEYGKKQKEMDKEISEVLRYAEIIYAREKHGFDLLVNKYGLDNVRLSHDLVLQNKGVHEENVFNSRYSKRSTVVKEKMKNVGIIPNIRSHQNMKDGMIVNLYGQIIEYLLNMNKTIYLLYHSKEDIELCKNIKKMYASNSNVVFIEQDLSCYEYEEFVKNFDFIIASRFHSIIHAYKENVPCIVLGWAQKYHDLLNEFEQSEFLFDVRENIQFDDIKRKIDMMNNCLSQERKKIHNNLNRIQEINCFDKVFESIRLYDGE